MPSILGTSRHRHSRHSSTPVKSTSNAPAVVLSTTPTEAKKSTNASKAQLRPSRRQEAKPVQDPLKSSIKDDKLSNTKTREDLDVFAYMDDEDEVSTHQPSLEEVDKPDEDHASAHLDSSTTTSSPVSAYHSSPHYSDLEVNADQQAKRQTWHAGYDQAGSFHSDSGISMGSSSADGDSPVLQHKYPSIRRASRFSTASHQPSIPEHHGLNVSPDPFAVQCPAFGADVWPPLKTAPSDIPEAYYVPHTSEAPKVLDPATFQLPVTPPELSPQLPRNRKHQPAKEASLKKQGYAQLASTISARDNAVIKPIYRKFETLNNRILLHLQDEVSELEAEWDRLDAAIAQEEHYPGKTKHAESRRAEAKILSPSRWRRNEVMSRCAGKINVYNQTLSSYTTLTKSLPSSSHSDIKTYQKWLTKHNPIAEPETTFLQHRNDLITVSSQSSQHAVPTILEYSPVTVALTILTTIIVFKFVPLFFARLVMSAVIGLALMCLISPASLVDLRLMREKRKGVAVYAAVMFMLAVVVD